MTAYAALFLSALLAATILPASSEAVLAGLAAGGAHDPAALLAVASVGNTAGSAINWGLGRFCLAWRDRPWFPVGPAQLERATAWYRRWGQWSLLFAWLPVVGDPLTLVAGVLRADFRLFLALVAIGKTARYAVVLGIVDRLVA